MRSFDPRRLVITSLILLLGGTLSAQDDSDLRRENEELRSLVERLESRVEALSAKVDHLETSGVNAESSNRVIEARVDELVATMAAMPQTGQTQRGYGITFYGFLRGDIALDTGRAITGNFARGVRQGGEEDEQLSITARQTRIGFLLDGPSQGEVNIDGRFEIDFFNGGPENQNLPQLRYAFARATWDAQDASVLAGQFQDIISPLIAPSLQYGGLWLLGDIGFRRPQVTVSKLFEVRDGHEVEAVFGLTRNIGASDFFGTSTLPNDDAGQDSAIPAIQARVEYMGEVADGYPTRIGVYGHYGQEDYDTPMGREEELDTWSIGVYFHIRIAEQWVVQGDGFYGTNLGTFNGGTGQGISLVTPENPQEIDSIGGWLAVTYEWQEDIRFNAGIGTDDPDNDDLAVGQRSSNFAIFGNAEYDIAQDATVGFELMWLETGYFGGGADDAFRIQSSFIFRF